MEEENTQGSGESHPRIHDYNPPGEERRSNDGGSSKTEQHESRVRVIDEKQEHRGDGQPHVYDYNPQGGERRESRVRVIDEKQEHRGDGPQQQAKEVGTELWSFARAWTDSGFVPFGTAAHLVLSWQRELADFLNMRVNKDLQFGCRLFGVRDLNDWVQLNSDYAREMVVDYASSVSDIMERSVKNAQQRSGPFISRNQEAAEHLRAVAERD